MFLDNIKTALDSLILKDKNLNYLYAHINKTQWQSITKKSKQAKAIRKGLFKLRDDLNKLNPETPELLACKQVVHDKLVYLATHWPLNEDHGRGTMYCPVSGNGVGYYARDRSDIALSNGFIYDFTGVTEALRSDQPFPTLPNISEYDVAKIRECSARYTNVAGWIAGAPTAFAVFSAIFVALCFSGAALPLIAIIGIPLAIGLVVGSIAGLISYKVNSEIRSLDILPTCSSANTFSTFRSKPSSDIKPDKSAQQSLHAASTHTATAKAVVVNLEENREDAPDELQRLIGGYSK